MNLPIPVRVTVAEREIPVTVAVAEDALVVGVKVRTHTEPVYHGATTVTPSGETQVLNTAGYVVRDNITVEPIPSNYGRIEWNGSFILVS